MAMDFQHILQQRRSRRSILKHAGLMLAASGLPAPLLAEHKTNGPFAFNPVARGLDETHHLAKGYISQPLLRWGDALFKNSPAFHPTKQTAHSQALQFGYNNDFIAYFPINGSSSHGLLCINHEYCTAWQMFPGSPKPSALSAQQQRTEMASVGCSVIEVKQKASHWHIIHSGLNRRITAETPMQLCGPAAGHARLCTRADPTGQHALGTFANCAGGQTPWQTYLSCEENIDGYFHLVTNRETVEQTKHRAFGIGGAPYHRWDQVDKRFNTAYEPNEPNRFGWVVEIDPFAPQSTPKKRTALGRFKHESATVVQNPDGRIVVYMGDDEAFQFLYKFVSHGRHKVGATHHHLLDEGTLYAARFDAEGRLHWQALVHGHGPLTPQNGFETQADVLIDARRAAQLLGATPMDRPEGIALHPDGRIYVALTQNPARSATDAVHRAAPNLMGYVLELRAEADDHSASTAQWNILLEGTQSGLCRPDNLRCDAAGNLWIATDGQPKTTGNADGLYACKLHGRSRGKTACFFRAPLGAEVTGPCFTPDQRTLFLSVQHPAEGSSYDAPSTRWPDFTPGIPARPSVLAITKEDGGIIGS